MEDGLNEHLGDRLKPFIEEVALYDDEIERMIREEAIRLMDPETKLVNVADLTALTDTRVRLAVERRLKETYPHLFGDAS
jgi:hypothetical protein